MLNCIKEILRNNTNYWFITWTNKKLISMLRSALSTEDTYGISRTSVTYCVGTRRIQVLTNKYMFISPSLWLGICMMSNTLLRALAASQPQEVQRFGFDKPPPVTRETQQWVSLTPCHTASIRTGTGFLTPAERWWLLLKITEDPARYLQNTNVQMYAEKEYRASVQCAWGSKEGFFCFSDFMELHNVLVIGSPYIRLSVELHKWLHTDLPPQCFFE